jgi:hypothetical protein
MLPDYARDEFTYFLEEVHKYTGIHKFNNGTIKEHIEKVEEILGLSFPKSYKEFLLIFNGGYLFEENVRICGVIDDSSTLISNMYDVVYNNINKVSSIPYSHLIVATYLWGDAVCLDTSSSKEVVYLWEHESGELSVQFDSFVDWLNCEIRTGAQVYNYDGSQKNTSSHESLISKLKNLFA